jgi:hypothetical protein
MRIRRYSRLEGTGARVCDARGWATIGFAEFHSKVCSLWGSQIKLSHFDFVALSNQQRKNRFHARRRAPPLYSARKRFGSAGDFS